jgi:hypothetical protein
MTRSKDKKLSSDGRAGYCQMMVMGKQSRLTTPGEAKYQEKVVKFLAGKLKMTTRAACVTGDDMPLFSDEE